MTPLKIGRVFNDLTVIEINDDGTVLCFCRGKHCKGMGTRIIKRGQLTSRSIKGCRKCASQNRITPTQSQPMPKPEPRKPEARTCTRFCIGRLIDGRWMIAHDPDCKKLNLFPVNMRTERRTEFWI